MTAPESADPDEFAAQLIARAAQALAPYPWTAEQTLTARTIVAGVLDGLIKLAGSDRHFGRLMGAELTDVRARVDSGKPASRCACGRRWPGKRGAFTTNSQEMKCDT